MIAIGPKRAGLDTGWGQGIEISEPIWGGTHFGAEWSSAGLIPEVPVGAVVDARPNSGGGVEVPPIAYRAITFCDAGVGGVIDIEGDGDSGALGDIGTDIHTAHVGS